MKTAAAFTAIIMVIIGGFVLFGKSQNKASLLLRNRQEISQTPINTSIPEEKVNIKASFKVITNGTERIFTDKKYHNKSEDVYIQLPDPGIVYIKKKGITWDDFFKTLPMKLTKDCLTTGTDQVFCSGDQGTLKFYLNDVDDKDLLDKDIKNGDKILIEFK